MKRQKVSEIVAIETGHISNQSVPAPGLSISAASDQAVNYTFVRGFRYQETLNTI